MPRPAACAWKARSGEKDSTNSLSVICLMLRVYRGLTLGLQQHSGRQLQCWQFDLVSNVYVVEYPSILFMSKAGKRGAKGGKKKIVYLTKQRRTKRRRRSALTPFSPLPLSFLSSPRAHERDDEEEEEEDAFPNSLPSPISRRRRRRRNKTQGRLSLLSPSLPPSVGRAHPTEVEEENRSRCFHLWSLHECTHKNASLVEQKSESMTRGK